MDEGIWSYQGDQFQCSMTLPMKGMGAIDITNLAGSDLNLSFSPFEKKNLDVALAWSAAPWDEARTGYFHKLTDQGSHYRLGPDTTKNLMYSMDSGGWFLFMEGTRTTHVPTLGWAVHATDFRQCLADLLPLSEDQVRDQVIYYRMGQRTLDVGQLNQIRDIATTLKALPDVKKVLVDSYTDKTGSRLTNLQLSRERTSDVVSALVSSGISSDLIEQRSHGERYPSADNNLKRGQDSSRKVTIRVIRSTDDARAKSGPKH